MKLAEEVAGCGERSYREVVRGYVLICKIDDAAFKVKDDERRLLHVVAWSVLSRISCLRRGQIVRERVL